ncbi:MAG: CopD family protein [Haloarculaceae archaeon]
MATYPLATRFVHVLGMALLLGGSAGTWGALRWFEGRPARAFGLAVRYEWLFWGVVAVMVVTGVGNVGAFGRGLPGPDSAWGATFTAKLLAVAGLLAGSLVRSLLVERCDDRSAPATRRAALARVRVSYGATAWYVVGLLALAEVLAHG